MFQDKKRLVKIAHYFSLGDLLSIENAGGLAHRNYFIQTSKGNYVVKILQGRSLANVQIESFYMGRLAQYNYPVVPFLQSDNGSVAYRDRYTVAVVLPRIGGQEFLQSPTSLSLLGSSLARLHAIPSTMLPLTNNWLSPSYLPSVLVELEGFYPAQITSCREVLATLGDFTNAVLPTAITHGDFTLDNCLLVDDKLFVIDWEESGIEGCLLDFAMCACQVCVVPSTQPNRYVFDDDLFQHLLSAYTSVRPFSREESFYLEQAIRYAALTLSLWMLTQSHHHKLPGQTDESCLYYWQAGFDTWSLRKALVS